MASSMIESGEVFQSRVKHLRESKKMTKTFVAESCGISPQCLGHYERGKMMPGMVVLIRLSDFFGVTIDYLVGKE
jgi:transcriptional regulator with XRE-family HTH domain